MSQLRGLQHRRRITTGLAPGAQQIHHLVEQQRRAHRLGQHLRDPDRSGGIHHLVPVIGGDHQHQRRPRQRQFANGPGRGHAIHARHSPVEEDDVIRLSGLDGPPDFRQTRRTGGRRRDDKTHTAQHFADHFAGVFVVVHQQYATRPQVGPGHEVQRRPLTDAQTGRKPEGGPRPQLAVDPDLATHQFGQTFRNDQTEPGPAILAGGRAVGLLETMEQGQLLFLGETDTGVTYVEPQQHLLIARLHHRNADRNLSLVGELDRVVGIIHQHLPQAERVAHEKDRDLLGDGDDELEVFGRALLGDQQRDIVEDVIQVEVDPLDHQVTRLDL